jgi:hypothetical protein
MTHLSQQEQSFWIQSHDHLSMTQALLRTKEIAFYRSAVKLYYSAEWYSMKDAGLLFGNLYYRLSYLPGESFFSRSVQGRTYRFYWNVFLIYRL